MNKLRLPVLLLGMALPFFPAAQIVKYKIRGTIGKLSAPAKAYLTIGDKLDSALIVKGRFSFDGIVEEPCGAHLMINKKGTGISAGEMGAMPYVLYFYIEPGTITITSADSINNAKVGAGALNAEYTKLKVQLRATDTALARLARYITTSPPEVKKADTFGTYIQNEMARIGLDQKSVFLNYIKNNPHALMSLYVLKCYGGFDYSMLRNNNPVTPGLNELEAVFNSLSATIRSTGAAVNFKNRIARLKKTAIGFMAMDFTQPDTSGKLISLHDFRGKYVLVDFWASWCGPCRAENPSVVKTYHAYKDKGFTVLSVSLDNAGAKAAWLKAIHDDQLTWTHVSDLKGWKNEAAQLYGINSIPQNLLIDPQGKIIAKDLRGMELEQAIKNLNLN